MKNFLNKLGDLLFPPDIKCLICGRELNGENATNSICHSCLAKMNFVINPCPICGDKMPGENNICENCKNRKTTHFNKSRSVFVYDGLAKSLIVDAKFDGKRYIAKSIAKFMFECYTTHRFNCNVVTFVASGTKRMKERGYNLSELVAKELSKLANLSCIATMKRVKESHQIDKTFAERQKNIAGAYELLPNINLDGKTVLLIDDVYTTGATMNECAHLLKTAGASDVFGLTFAHTVKASAAK